MTKIKMPVTATTEMDVNLPFYAQHKYDSQFVKNQYYMWICDDYCIKIDGAKIEKLGLSIYGFNFRTTAIEEQAEAKEGFYTALAEASAELNQALPKTYFLFGGNAVAIYREYEDANCSTIEKVKGVVDSAEYDVCEFSHFDNPALLLDTASGWDDYSQISKEEYDYFQSFIANAQHEKEDREREMTEEDNNLKNSQL